MKDIDFVIEHQGDSQVNSVAVIYQTEEILLLEVDMKTKYVGIDSTCGNSFMIETYEHSLNKVDCDGSTCIRIPEAEGYTFFSGSGGGYTLSVTFVKDSIYNE